MFTKTIQFAPKSKHSRRILKSSINSNRTLVHKSDLFIATVSYCSSHAALSFLRPDRNCLNFHRLRNSTEKQQKKLKNVRSQINLQRNAQEGVGLDQRLAQRGHLRLLRLWHPGKLAFRIFSFCICSILAPNSDFLCFALSSKPWTTLTCHSSLSTFDPMASTSTAATATCLWE